MAGIAAYLYLLGDIYAHSFYVEISDDYLWELAEYLEIDEDKAKEIIATMVEVRLFDRKLYEQYAILSSKGIQLRYLSAKGKSALSYLLANKALFLLENDPNVAVIGEKTPENGDLSPKNTEKKGQNPQSKVKESRVNMYYYPSSTPQNENSQDSKDVPVGFAALARRFQSELLHDEEWCYSLCQTSGKGSAVLNLLPDIFPVFDAHIIATGDTGTITRLGDYKRRLLNWWRCMRFESAQEIRERSQPPAENTGRGKRNPPVSKVDEALSAAEEAATMACEILNRA